MKDFKQYLNEAKRKNYYTIGGDRYDGGVVTKVFIDGKKVFTQILDGNEDYKYNGKKYPDISKFLDAIAQDHGLGSGDDLERVEVE